MEEERLDGFALRTGKRIDYDLALRADEAIRAGYGAGRAAVRERHGKRKRRALAVASLFFIIIGGLISIRVSPVFASAVRHLPGMEAIVDAINRDYANNETLQDALDNDYVQKIGISDEHDGLKFTVDGIVADESRMVLVYTIVGLGRDERHSIGNIGWKDKDGHELGVAFGFSGYASGSDDSKAVTDSVEVLFSEQSPLPDEMGMTIKLRDSDYTVFFKIDKLLFAGNERIVPLNVSLMVSGQEIVFEQARISPLRIAIEARYPDDNTKTIFSAGDMKIVDDEGKEWGVANISAGTSEPTRARFEFKSNYFRQPKKLYVTGTWFRALDKNKMKLVVDTEKGVVVDAPDRQVEVIQADKSFGKTQLGLGIKVTNEADRMAYMLLRGPFVDAAGKRGEAVSTGTSSHFVESKYTDMEDRYEIPAGDYEQPLTFELHMYPQYIEQPYRIEIPIRS
ncbi:DUF4179 domain-containing protein [Cohnella sp. 56]|uniref:DUF4179 domain-containing protein n=1 Tax=Cohnella sp. 56 TaxID=3113722 RepID=UPI0030E964A7